MAPVTALIARRVQHEPNLICQPGTSPGIKTHSSPAAFSNNSLPPIFPLTLHLPAPPHPVVPQAPLTPCGPPLPQNNGFLLFARRLGSIISSTVWPARRPLHNGAGEAPGVPAGRRQLSHATALDTGFLLLPFKLRLPIHHTSRLHHGRPRPRQLVDSLRHRCVTAASPLRRPVADLHRGWV